MERQNDVLKPNDRYDSFLKMGWDQVGSKRLSSMSVCRSMDPSISLTDLDGNILDISL